jgi:hypothetical protein
MTLKEALATDLTSVFAADLTETVEIDRNGTTLRITALMENMEQNEVDGFGGANPIALRRVHIKTSDLASMSPGDKLYIMEPNKLEPGKETRVKKTVVSVQYPECGSEIIVTCRS